MLAINDIGYAAAQKLINLCWVGINFALRKHAVILPPAGYLRKMFRAGSLARTGPVRISPGLQLDGQGETEDVLMRTVTQVVRTVGLPERLDADVLRERVPQPDSAGE